MMRNTTGDRNETEDRCNQTLSAFGYTQKKLKRHFGSLCNNQIFKTMAKEIHHIKSPAVQTMMDNWHQSGVKSWEQWVNNSALINLRQSHPDTFYEIQNYQSQFTQNIYAPLSQYLSTPHDAFKGLANDLIRYIFVIYNNLKLRKIAPNSCLQIDVRSRHDIVTETTIDPGLETTHITDDAIARIIDECLLCGDSYCYKRYEVLLHGKDHKSFEAVLNNTVPDCAFECAPLCMIFNSTASIEQLLDQLHTKSEGLITVSFHVYHHSIKIYLYVANNLGQLFGSRMFVDNLQSVIPSLFENTNVDNIIINDLNKYSEFKPDVAHKQYYNSLMKHVVNQNGNDIEQKLLDDDISRDELDPLFLSKLETTVNSWNSGDKCMINTIKECFIKNNVNTEYFKNHKRKHLMQLLKQYHIKAAVVIKLWSAFTTHNSNDNDENETKILSKIDDSASIQTQNHMFLERINSLQKQLQEKDEEIYNLKQENCDLKRVIQNAITDDDNDDIQAIEPNNLSLLSLDNNIAAVPPQLSKNDTYLSLFPVRGELGNNYLKNILEETAFVLFILYVYRRYYRFTEK